MARPGRPQTRRVVALEPVIDQMLGESSQIRYHSPVLQSAVDGLFAAKDPAFGEALFDESGKGGGFAEGFAVAAEGQGLDAESLFGGRIGAGEENGLKIFCRSEK